MKRLGSREGKGFAQDHTASHWQSYSHLGTKGHPLGSSRQLRGPSWLKEGTSRGKGWCPGHLGSLHSSQDSPGMLQVVCSHSLMYRWTNPSPLHIVFIRICCTLVSANSIYSKCTFLSKFSGMQGLQSPRPAFSTDHLRPKPSASCIPKTSLLEYLQGTFKLPVQV